MNRSEREKIAKDILTDIEKKCKLGDVKGVLILSLELIKQLADDGYWGLSFPDIQSPVKDDPIPPSPRIKRWKEKLREDIDYLENKEMSMYFEEIKTIQDSIESCIKNRDEAQEALEKLKDVE